MVFLLFQLNVNSLLANHDLALGDCHHIKLTEDLVFLSCAMDLQVTDFIGHLVEQITVH